MGSTSLSYQIWIEWSTIRQFQKGTLYDFFDSITFASLDQKCHVWCSDGGCRRLIWRFWWHICWFMQRQIGHYLVWIKFLLESLAQSWHHLHCALANSWSEVLSNNLDEFNFWKMSLWLAKVVALASAVINKEHSSISSLLLQIYLMDPWLILCSQAIECLEGGFGLLNLWMISMCCCSLRRFSDFFALLLDISTIFCYDFVSQHGY